MGRTFGVGILGAGIGENHVRALITLPDRFRVVTVCALEQDQASRIAALAPGARTDSDIAKVLNDPDVDLVVNGLPPHLHCPVTLDALAAGKHVVCEKPMALSIRDAVRMRDAALSADRVLAPVFQYRYGLGFRQLRHLIASGLAGRPLVASLETHWNRGDDYYALPWRGTWEREGGGAILSHAIHAHDLLTVAMGPIAKVSATLATRVNDIEVDDCAAIAFTMASGALATSSITLGAAEDTSRLRFCFSNLTAESGLSPYHPAQAPWTFTARTKSEQSAIDEAVGSIMDGPESFAGFYAALGHRLMGAETDIVTPDDGLRSVELVTALYRSSRSGNAVSLPLSADALDASGWGPG